MQTNKDGKFDSTDTEVIAEIVTPARPACPSVVTTQTVLAAFDIASKKSDFISLSQFKKAFAFSNEIIIG